jgi:hypothetical protein
MSLEKDITMIKSMLEAKPIFKPASQKQIAKRHEGTPILTVISVAYYASDDPSDFTLKDITDPQEMKEMILGGEEVLITYIDSNEQGGRNSDVLSDLMDYGFRVGREVIYPEQV